MKTRGNGLVGVLAAVLIVVVLALVFTVGTGALTGKSNLPPRPDGQGQTIVGRSLAKARDTECRSNLAQVRLAIQVATDPVDGSKPADLASVRVPAEFRKCPVGDEPYKYDAAEGTVSCPHPGHEKY